MLRLIIRENYQLQKPIVIDVRALSSSASASPSYIEDEEDDEVENDTFI